MDLSTFDMGNSTPAPAMGNRVLLIGVGGGGCNAVAHMHSGWREGPDIIAVNTDAQSLAACPVTRRIQIGQNLTEGLSAGGEAAVGKLAAEEEEDVIREIIGQYDLVFIVASLGGGTGSGAAPVIARIARESGALAIGFAALPFSFEGERRRKLAEESLEEFRESSDVVITLPNQMLPDLLGEDTSLSEAFGKVDMMVGVAIRTIWKLLAQSGIINLDLADLSQLVENSGGSCRFGYGEGRGPNKVADAIASVLKGPLLNEGKVLADAPALLVSLVGGTDLTLSAVQKLMSQLAALARQDVRFFMGAAVDETWTDRVAITILAAETWEEEQVLPPEPRSDAAVVPESGLPPKVGARSKKKSRRNKEVQTTLKFDSTEKGRFKNVEPTIYDGEDLDIPTYMRRGIKLSFEK